MYYALCTIRNIVKNILMVYQITLMYNHHNLAREYLYFTIKSSLNKLNSYAYRKHLSLLLRVYTCISNIVSWSGYQFCNTSREWRSYNGKPNRWFAKSLSLVLFLSSVGGFIYSSLICKKGLLIVISCLKFILMKMTS